MIESLYFLKITSRYCKHDIRINDLYCTNNYKGNQSGSEIPINDLLRKGKNSIKIKIEPVLVEAADRDVIFMINAVIEERNSYDNSIKRELINLKSEVPLNEIPKEIEDSYLIEEPFINPDYTKSPIIVKNKEILGKVYGFYEHVYKLMYGKDITSLIELFADKEKNFAYSYNLNPQERIEYIKSSLTDYLTEPNSELLTLDLNFLNYETYAYEKLICLEEKVNKRPALGIYSELFKSTTYFPIYLSINEKTIQIAK